MNKYKPVQKDDNWLIICELCGEPFNKLGSHIYWWHKMLTSQYRQMFGLNANTRLMSDESIEIARYNNEINKDIVIKENLIKKWINTRYKKGHEWRTLEKIAPQEYQRLLNNKRFWV